MDAITAIFSRQSTKDFLPKQIEDSLLQTVLDCGMTAPVGMRRYDNLHLTVIQDQKLLADITEASGLRTPERPYAPFYKAPTVILVSSRFERTDHIEYANAACVISNMALAATASGIGSVYLWSAVRTLNSNPDLLARLRLLEGFIPVSMLALGYSSIPLTPHNTPRHTVDITRIV